MRRTYSVLCGFFFALCLPYVFFYSLGPLTTFQDGLKPTGYKIRSRYNSASSGVTSSPTSSTTEVTPTSPFTCEPEVNVAYIKTHKTASTTLQTIFNRYGFFQNLSFIVNKRSAYNGHFDYLVLNSSSQKKYFLPPLHVRDGDYKMYKNYNMIAVHVRYYREVLDKFMANGTRYFTIIREPSAQWESAFNHFEFRKAISKVAGKKNILEINSTFAIPFNKNTSSVDAIEEFLRKPEFYHKTLRSVSFQNTKDLLWHYARNNQMFDLGLPTDLHHNETIVNATIDGLSNEMDLVIINEYFDESLVVMKKMLCWTFKDILYLSKNQRPERSDLTEETRAKIRRWNSADVLLYDRFNKTLWKHIDDYGLNFNQDLIKFRSLLNETHHNCSAESKIIKWGNDFKHMEFLPKANSSLFCQTIAESKAALFKRIFTRQKPISKPQRKKRIPRKRVRPATHVKPLPKVPNKLEKKLTVKEIHITVNETAPSSRNTTVNNPKTP